MKLLVLAIDGRGLGHLNRTGLLAKALGTAAPEAEVRFLVESPAYWILEQSGFTVLKLPDPMHPLGRYAINGRRAQLEADLMRPILDGWRPDGVMLDFVVDHALFHMIKSFDCRLLLVVRRLTMDAAAELAADEAQRLVDAFVLPHAEAEFGAGEIPGAIRRRCCFTGPLVRPLDLERAAVLRHRATSAGARFVLVTLGGGGWAQAHGLASAARSALRQIRPAIPEVDGLIVHGPLFEGPLPEDEPGIRSVRFERELPELMAAADAVVCPAGYNSALELTASGAPGVVVPMTDPGRDDQVARAKELAHRGIALVAGSAPEDIAGALMRILAGGGPPRRRPRPGPDLRSAGSVLAESLRRS